MKSHLLAHLSKKKQGKPNFVIAKNWLVHTVSTGLVILLLLCVLGLSELICLLLFYITKNENFYASYLKTKIKQVVTIENQRDLITMELHNFGDIASEYVVHPYVGYVGDITMPFEGINRFGWIGPDPLMQYDDTTVVVLVTGGSFAVNLYTQSGEVLSQLLAEIPQYQGKRIVVTSAALSGYKQPQQLMLLQYLLTLGAHIDVVINIDGYNEIALPFIENAPFQVAAVYPRSWRILSDPTIRFGSPDKKREYDVLRNVRAKLASVWDHQSMQYSIVSLMLWNIQDIFLQNRLASLDIRISEAKKLPTPKYQWTGPDLHDQGSTEEQMIAIWKNASLQMSRVAQANGMLYIHVLQPNQYAKVKPWSQQEIDMGLPTMALEDSAEGIVSVPTIASLYSRLEQEEDVLRHEGVHVLDATDVYAYEPRTVYVDDCCHVNATGSDIVVEYIVQEMRTILTSQ